MSETATGSGSDAPLIIISYHGEDENWSNLLVSTFPTDLDIRFVFNRVDLYSGRIDKATGSAIAEAKALILLLSQNYLTTSWISKEESNDISQFEKTSGGLSVVPVLVRECTWQETPFLQKYAISAASNAGKPIAEAATDLQPKSLTAVVSRVLTSMGVSHPDVSSTAYAALTVVAQRWDLSTNTGYFKVSMEVRRILGHAWACVRFSDIGAAEITSEILLVAFSELGKLNPRPEKTPQFLWKQLSRAKQGKNTYQSLLESRFPGVERVKDAIWNSHTMPPATKNTLAALQLADELSLQTYKARADSAAPPRHSIGARHLLAALLVLVPEDGPSGAVQILSEITDINVLRNRFFDFIVKSLPDDNHEAWRRILVVDLPKKVTKARQRGKAVAEYVIQEDVKATGNVTQHAVLSESPFAGNVVESPSIPSSESVATGGGSVSTPSSPMEADFSVLEKELSKKSAADQVLLQPDEQVISEEHTDTADEEELDLKPILAGFATDYWDGRDLLDTTQDVNALASLVSAWSVEPPLSIGLFGDWGSGKSHFMRQMRKRVEKLSRSARKANDKKQKEIGYYKNIVQIEFNAWHYIEGNLWASLVDHIFANLKVSEKEDLTLAEARRDKLMEELGVKKEIESKIKAKIEERKTELETKQKEATDLAKQAEDKKEKASEELAGFKSLAEEQLNKLQVPLSFSEQDQALLARLGIQPSELRTAGDYRKRYDELKGLGNRLRAQLTLFRTDSKERRQTLLAALLAAIPLAGALLLKLPQMISLPVPVATVLAGVATILGAALPTWNQVRKARESLKENEAAVERELEKKKVELQGEVNALTKTIQDAEAEAETIGNEITGLQKKIDTTSTSTILAEFIEDRAAASDYRRHLGLLALIRRDFEKLRELFEQQRNEEKEGTESHDDNRINRIVLYIDDLDRCPPQRVVEVLQAIHLLLAFPIFVVVVGVDARWVTRSLQESYEWLRVEESDTKKEVAESDGDMGNVQGATPHDYLEKIFQIPFWLRPMEETQTMTFIEGLTEQVRYRPPIETSEVKQGSNGNQSTDQSIQTDQVTESVAQEAAASGNGQPPLTIGDLEPQLNETDDGSVGKEAQVEQTPATSDGIKVNDGNVVAATVPGESPDAPNLNASRFNITNEIDDSTDDSESKHETETEEEDDGEMIDLAPHSLTLGDEEIEYMKSLAELIGRSPRAVKRFLNCYRLIKVSLSPKQLEKFVQKGASYEYRAVMILLGIITGAPTVSLFVTEEIENWKWAAKKGRPTMADFSNQLEKNEDIARQPDWTRLKTFLGSFTANEESAELFAAFKRNTPKVSRYSFRIARAEAAGPRRTSTMSQVKGSVTPKASA